MILKTSSIKLIKPFKILILNRYFLLLIQKVKIET